MDPLKGGQAWPKSDQADRPELSPNPRKCHKYRHASTARGGQTFIEQSCLLPYARVFLPLVFYVFS